MIVYSLVESSAAILIRGNVKSLSCLDFVINVMHYVVLEFCVCLGLVF